MELEGESAIKDVTGDINSERGTELPLDMASILD